MLFERSARDDRAFETALRPRSARVGRMALRNAFSALAAAGMMSAAAQAGPVQATAAREAPAPARTIDVRGVALGMTPAQAQQAIAAAGLPAVDRGGYDQAAQGFGIDRVRPNSQNDLVFVSSMVSRARRTAAKPENDEAVAVVFTPEAGKERVWGTGVSHKYAPADMPSVANTMRALADKYGNTSWMSDMSHAAFLPGVRQDQRTFGAMLLWYWDADGRQGGPAPHETCRYGLHQAYILNQIDFTSMRTVNAVFEKPFWFDEALRSGCARVVRAMMNWNTDGAVTDFTVEAVDLKAGVEATRRLEAVVAAREADAAHKRADQASRNQAAF